MCRYNLTEDSAELIGMPFVYNVSSQTSGMQYSHRQSMFLSHMCSHESVCLHGDMMQKVIEGREVVEHKKVNDHIIGYRGLGAKNHLFGTAPADYVTITYKDSNGNPTGSLKIVTMNATFTSKLNNTDHSKVFEVIAKNGVIFNL